MNLAVVRANGAFNWDIGNIAGSREAVARLAPQPTAGDMKQITRPESVLTLDDIDRHKVTTVLGKGTAQAMEARR